MAINIRDCVERFAELNIDVHADFHTLNSEQVQELLYLAKDQGYKWFNDGNGSLSRYFFYAVKRLHVHYEAGQHAYNNAGVHIALHAERPTRTRAAWAAGYKAAQKEWREACPTAFAEGMEWKECERRLKVYREKLKLNTRRMAV